MTLTLSRRRWACYAIAIAIWLWISAQFAFGFAPCYPALLSENCLSIGSLAWGRVVAEGTSRSIGEGNWSFGIDRAVITVAGVALALVISLLLAERLSRCVQLIANCDRCGHESRSSGRCPECGSLRLPPVKPILNPPNLYWTGMIAMGGVVALQGVGAFASTVTGLWVRLGLPPGPQPSAMNASMVTLLWFQWSTVLWFVAVCFVQVMWRPFDSQIGWRTRS